MSPSPRSFGSLYAIRQQAIYSKNLCQHRPSSPSTVEACTAPSSLTEVLEDGTCERCYQPWQDGPHGLGLCPLEHRGFLNLAGRDQLFSFVTQGIHPQLPQGLRVSSAKQFERLLKRHGVTADLSLHERVQRRTSGLATRASQERRAALWQRVRPRVVEQLAATRRLTMGHVG